MNRRVVIAALVCLSLFAPAAFGNDNIEFHFIKVGQGDCVLIKCPDPDGRIVFVDCGRGYADKGTDSFYAKEYISEELGESPDGVLPKT